MTGSCAEYQLLLQDRLTGDLEASGAVRLDAHLAACAGCRAEAKAFSEALDLVKLPPPSPEETRALDTVADRTLSAFRSAERRRSLWRRTLVGFAAAAAAVAMVLTPTLLRGPGGSTAAPWREPNLDALWAASAVADPSAEGSTSDPALVEAALADLGDTGSFTFDVDDSM